jgi:hypothetical protein
MPAADTAVFGHLGQDLRAIAVEQFSRHWEIPFACCDQRLASTKGRDWRRPKTSCGTSSTRRTVVHDEAQPSSLAGSGDDNFADAPVARSRSRRTLWWVRSIDLRTVPPEGNATCSPASGRGDKSPASTPLIKAGPGEFTERQRSQCIKTQSIRRVTRLQTTRHLYYGERSC